MIVKLYKTNSDPRDVDKILYSEISVDAMLKGECSVTNPLLMLQKGSHGFFAGYNYLYIPELGRYYFIDNIAFLPGNYIDISTHVDVLMSFKTQIRGINAFIERQEYVFNPYMNDNLTPIAQGSIIDVLDVGQVGNNTNVRNIYLTCVGGVE